MDYHTKPTHSYRFVRPEAGKGKELCELLKRELSVPEDAVKFSVTFSEGSITVMCEYRPQEPVKKKDLPSPPPDIGGIRRDGL